MKNWKVEVYILDIIGDNFQDKLIRNVLDHDKKDNEHILNVLSLYFCNIYLGKSMNSFLEGMNST